MDCIYLAVGHGEKPGGGHDPGAVSANEAWNEQSAGDIIVLEAATYLRSLGVEVQDEAFQADPNFAGTARMANAWGADFVVSVHHDYNLAPEGAFGHWYVNPGKAIADSIQAAVGVAGFPLRPSWHKRRTDLSLLKNTVAPSVIYECGRIGQASLDEPAELQRMGRAIAVGIARHIGAEQEEDTMTDDDRKLLKELLVLAKLSRVSEIAFSYDREWERGKDSGWTADELSQVLAAKTAAVLDERNRLGL